MGTGCLGSTAECLKIRISGYSYATVSPFIKSQSRQNHIHIYIKLLMVALVVKNPPTNAGDARDMGSIPGLGRFPGRGYGNPLQHSCLGNHMNRGGWRATSMGSQRVGHDSAYTHLSTYYVHSVGPKDYLSKFSKSLMTIAVRFLYTKHKIW